MEKKLERMRATLRRRLALFAMGSGCILLLAVLASTRTLSPLVGDTHYADFFAGFQTGMLFGLEAVAIFFVVRDLLALRDDARLTALLLEEQDERTQYVEQMAGRYSWRWMTILLLAAAVVAGYFSIGACVALICAALAEALLTGILRFHFNRQTGGTD